MKLADTASITGCQIISECHHDRQVHRAENVYSGVFNNPCEKCLEACQKRFPRQRCNLTSCFVIVQRIERQQRQNKICITSTPKTIFGNILISYRMQDEISLSSNIVPRIYRLDYNYGTGIWLFSTIWPTLKLLRAYIRRGPCFHNISSYLTRLIPRLMMARFAPTSYALLI